MTLRGSFPIALVAALLLGGCGDDAPKTPAKPGEKPVEKPATPPTAGGPTLEGAAGARAVVEAYLAAAKVPDEAAMYALGTPEWQNTEKTKPRRFTPAIAKGQFKLKSAEVRDPTVEGDTANVSVRAVFVDEKGKDDNEGMRFQLVRKDGRWWITELG